MKRKFHELNQYSYIFYNTTFGKYYNFDFKDSDSGVIFNDSWFWFGIPESILGQVYEILLSCEPLEEKFPMQKSKTSKVNLI